MRKKTLYILFTALFIGICLMPALGMLVFGESEAAANEILAQKPSLTQPDGSFNESVTEEMTDYIADRFAGRQECITAYARLQAALFRESASEKVILGKDGWLFFADTLDDYYRRSTMTDREIYGVCRTLEMMQEYAQAHGADFVFTVAPNKNSLPEGEAHMPHVKTFPDGEICSTRRTAQPFDSPKNLARLRMAWKGDTVNTARLHGYEVNAVWLEETLSADGLYHRLDSHWNRLGAARAHKEVMRSLDRKFVDWTGENYDIIKEHKGDLYEMLYPAGKELDENAVFERPFRFRYLDVTDVTPFAASEIKAGYGGDEAPPPDKQLLETVSEEGEGTLLMFRDSFGNALHPFFAEDFARAAFSRQMPYRLDWLEGGTADVLIVEIVERNLKDLAERAPVMPAPKADPGFSPAEDPEREMLLKTEPSGEMPGYVKVSGVYDSQEIPEDTPVYISTQTDLFEACPVGTDWTETAGHGCFTAYLPEEAVNSGILSVVIKGKRDWRICTNLTMN